LTYRAAAVAGRAGAADGLRDIARPVMNELQAATTETVHLAAPDGQALVLIQRLDSPHPLRAFMALGERFALHASAAGLAYLAACGEHFTDDYLAAVTHVDPTDTRTVLDETRRRGYAVSVDEMSSGISSIGAPIVGSAGPVAALSVSGPSSRIGAERFEELGARVFDAAGRISGAIYQRGDG
jgi:IclR family acetate operon transcriptional repressor